jgi:hypothetical protein
MAPSLFDALFALLMTEGQAVNVDQVQAVLADPARMTAEVAQMRRELEADLQILQAAHSVLLPASLIPMPASTAAVEDPMAVEPEEPDANAAADTDATATEDHLSE